MRRIQIVDLVRSFSILVVLAIHLGCHYVTTSTSNPFLHWVWYKLWVNGGYGVTAFFVVSGFVITRLIASQPKPYGLFNPDFRDFYSRRAGRILPLLATTCIVGLLAVHFLPDSSYPFHYCFKDPNADFRPSFWLSVATFTFYWYGLAHHLAANPLGLHWDLLWSLSVEEQFYFCYPFLLKKLGTERNLRLLLVVLIFYPPVYAALHGFYFPTVAIPILGDLAPFGAIATGCLLYLASERFKDNLTQSKKTALAVCLLGLALFAHAYLHQDYKADLGGHIIESSLLTWGLFLFLLGGLHLDFFNSKLWSPIAWPGVLSYGGYLIHPTILYFLWVFISGKNEYLAFLLFALGTFTVAHLSYRYFEMPVNLWVRGVLGRSNSKGG